MDGNIKKTYAELYKELEYINCEEVFSHDEKPVVRREGATFNGAVLRYIRFNRMFDVFIGGNIHFTTQCEVFQDAMKLALISGQFAGLIPVVGVLERDVSKARFQVRSIRFIYSCAMTLVQMVAAAVCLYRLFEGAVTVRKLGSFSFYFSTFLTSVVFLQLATKWQYLLQQVAAANLNEYIDQSIKFKCNCATVALLGTALIEHILLIIARVSVVLDCYELDDGIYGAVIEKMFLWIFQFNVSYTFPMGIILLLVNFISTINWSYSHVFIVCVSLYLTSILEQINKRIMNKEGEYFPPSHWQKLREDYNRATKLVGAFDAVINITIFFSFASNLFFVCLQLYNTMSNVMKTYSNITECPHYPSGPFYGYELLTYYLYSLFFIISRFLAVALIASRVHTASRVPAPYLYSIPSSAYCTEVDRFIQQVHGSFTALSGLNFFYVTKELILSVASTVVTYELVLLQIDD